MFGPSLKPYLVMKRKLLSALIIVAGLSFTACQDETMDELIQDTELNETTESSEGGSTGSGGTNDPGNGDGGVGGGSGG